MIAGTLIPIHSSFGRRVCQLARVFGLPISGSGSCLDFGLLPAVVVVSASIDRITKDAADGGRRPALVAAPCTDARLVEALDDLVGRELLIHEPTVNHPDDCGFFFVDDELAGTCLGSWRVTVSVRR